MADRNEVKSFKWRSLKDKAPPNSVLYVLEGTQDEIGAYVTDKWGKPIPLSKVRPNDILPLIDKGKTNIVIVKEGKITSKKIESESLMVDYDKNLESIWIELKHKYLKPGDNISLLTNDKGYITDSEASLIINNAVKELEEKIEKIPTKTSDLINDGENGTGKYITTLEHGTKVFDFSNTTSVLATHNYGRYVNVEVLIGVNKVLADVEYNPGGNSVLVKFSKEETGKVIIS